jgi:transcriptional regulator with XRE-family HTH domain
MNEYRYTECGLDNVVITGIGQARDDADIEFVSIPNVNGLHRAIAEAIVERNALMNGRELRFLRSEMGMTQAELATMIHREPLTVSRWERGETEIEANAETLIRLHAIARLNLTAAADVAGLSQRSVPRAIAKPIEIDGSDPQNYRSAA